MRGPAITLRCDCGAEGRAAYTERWTCQSCGRVYETSRIPESDYAAVAALDRRYRWGGRAIVAVLAVLVLAVGLTGQLMPIFAGLGVSLLSWFLYIKPLVHRRHKRAIQTLIRRWELTAE